MIKKTSAEKFCKMATFINIKDEEELLSIDDTNEKTSSGAKEDIMTSVLTRLSENMNATSESLKRRQEANRQQPANLYPAAKIAKLPAQDTMSESDNSDCGGLPTDKAL